ncbi:hypothetical protein GALMADRAFT_17237, partial [Galerina marginata CBS 339.88]
MTKVVNLLSAKAEMGAPMICMYLLGNPDHYTNYTFVPFYWQSFKGKILGLSPVYDYIYRSAALENLCLYDWIQHYERKKVKKAKVVNTANEINDNVIENEAADQSNISLDSYLEDDGENEEPKSTSKNVFRFTQKHPLHDSHASHYISKSEKRIPNFIGATLPRCDQGDRNYYCSTMLTLFKPWRKGYDLKSNDTETWDECFNNYKFSNQQEKLMQNFNIKYECLDARDDYRAQLKKGLDKGLIGSWD